MSDTHSESVQQGIGYVRTQDAPLKPPPASEIGLWGWLRHNIFASMSDFSTIGAAIGSLLMIVVTFAVLYAGVATLWSLFQFSFLDAVWSDPDGVKRLACATTQQGGEKAVEWSGACWPFMDAKWKLATYYAYPTEELWRPNLVMLVGAVGVAWLVSDAISRRWLVGVVLLAAGIALAWWASQPIPADGAALLNDVDTMKLDPAATNWFHDTWLYQRFTAYPVGAWMLALIGILYILLAQPVGRGMVGLLMLTVYPVFAFVLLTGGDLEGGTGFWVTLGLIAAFGLLCWLIAKVFGETGMTATLIGLLVAAVAAYALYQFFEPLTGIVAPPGADAFSRSSDGMVIRLPVPGALLGQVMAALALLALLAILAGVGGLGMGMRMLLGLPALLMIANSYGDEPTQSLALPVGWIIWLLLAVGLIGFLLMIFAGLRRGEWHSAMYGFGSGSGLSIAFGALIVGLVAFVGGHWFVDLVEYAARGEIGEFLSAEHLSHHGGLNFAGIDVPAQSGGEEVPREVWPLPVVETSVWGGLLVTLVVAVAGIVASLPLGVLLALGRRSQLPAVRILSIGFIEFWRGVPLITVLFMSSVMLPLFLPEGTEFNKLLRALIGVALFASAYMAEVIRGGLQAISKGQYEGADSLGLGYGQKMRLIVLPQALTLVIPGIVNTFIGLFKDTTLVLIIGLFDLLGAIQTTFTDSSWSTPVANPTGYLLAAAIFWIFCFGMSRYSMFMENRLRRGHSR